MRNRLAIVVLLLTLCSSAPLLPAQGPASPSTDSDRKHAIELYHEGKYVDALSILEKLNQRYPNDVVVQEVYGFCVLASSAGIQDPDRRQSQRARAYQILQH